MTNQMGQGIPRKVTLLGGSLQQIQGTSVAQAGKSDKTKVSPDQNKIDRIAYKNKLKSIATQKYPNIQKRDQAFMEIACEKPAVKEKYQKLLDLLKKYPKCCVAVQLRSWERNCKMCGLGMTMPIGEEKISLQEFRIFWNAAVDEVAIAIGKEAGCSEAFWGACGTVSAFSDVDIAIIGKGLSPSDANIYATARNAVHTSALGGHSGIQLDTEPYLPHPAKNDTSGFLSGSPEAHARYIACEKANVAFQYYVSLNGHPKEYQKAKQEYLKGIADPVHREGMKHIFAQVEAIMDHIETEVTDEILLQNGKTEEDIGKMLNSEKMKEAAGIKSDSPTAYKLARENVTPRMRTKIGEAIKTIDKEIEVLQKQIIEVKLTGTTQQENINRLDDLKNKRNEMFSEMNLLQDEGTYSQAEGKVTLLQESGQMHVGAKKGAVKKLAAQDKQQTGVKAFLLKKGGGKISELLYKGKMREMLKPKGYEKPTAETLSIASHEENVQRKHMFIDAMQSVHGPKRDEVAMKALGHTKQAKYAERTTKNTYRALSEKKEELEQQGKLVPKSLIGLKKRAKTLMEQSKNLLSCMRKDSLGTEATEELLGKTVFCGTAARNLGKGDSVRVRANIRKVVDLFEPGGREDGKPMEKYEKMNVMIQEMMNLRLIDFNDVLEVKVKDEETGHTHIHLKPKNPEIRKILEARSGYSIENPEHSDLIPLHDEALKITCKRLKLDTVKAAKKFDKEVDRLNQDCENLFIDNGWMPKVTKENAKKFDFIGILLMASNNFEANLNL